MSISELTLQSVVDDAEIESFTFFEISAARRDSDVSGDPELSEDQDEDVRPVHSVQTAAKDDDAGFRIRIRTEIEVSVGTIVSDVSVDYTLKKIRASEIPAALLLDFINNVAVMALVPYIRQSVADVTQRVFGAALLMPIVRRGELTFDLADSTDTEE